MKQKIYTNSDTQNMAAILYMNLKDTSSSCIPFKYQFNICLGEN